MQQNAARYYYPINKMSKTKLKKELSSLTKEQLIEVILDCYQYKGEAGEFFKFYLNPDIKTTTEQFKVLAYKESQRTKRGRYSKMRFSFMNTLVKKYECLNDDVREVLSFRLYILDLMVTSSLCINYTEAQHASITKFLFSVYTYAEAHLLSDVTLQHITNLINKPYITAILRKRIVDYLNDSLGISLQQ